MTVNQRIENNRCTSPIQISGLAFDILKVNPFNQMLVRDQKLSETFFSSENWISLLTEQ